MNLGIRAFSHVVLPVSDLDESLGFYSDTLGLEIVMRQGAEDPDASGSIAAGLRIAGVLVPGDVMLELVEGMDAPTASSTVLALNVPDVRAAQAKLQERGVSPRMPPTEVMPGVTMMFLADPDGRTVELVEFASGAHSSYGNLPSGS